jgi:hypothetical protein
MAAIMPNLGSRAKKTVTIFRAVRFLDLGDRARRGLTGADVLERHGFAPAHAPA